MPTVSQVRIQRLEEESAWSWEEFGFTGQESQVVGPGVKNNKASFVEVISHLCASGNKYTPLSFSRNQNSWGGGGLGETLLILKRWRGLRPP